MDSLTKIFSFIFGGICVGAIIMLLFFRKSGEPFMWITIVILFAALVSSYLMIPRIFVNKEIISIKTTFVNIKIPVADIQTIEKYERIGFNIRTFGVGGLFGYFGYFNGNDVWYVTNIRKKVKISMKSRKIYMISPENPDEFINEIKK
ncbi:MAG: PH domain-containing protein [Weeksellaceae bacterium]|nr:PH domain-containing protein [Bacteroidota bacterium]MCG2781932.1 PH domain-containing protein [Weeksellaceae bacterium]